MNEKTNRKLLELLEVDKYLRCLKPSNVCGYLKLTDVLNCLGWKIFEQLEDGKHLSFLDEQI